MILAKTADPKVLSEVDDQEIKLCAALLCVAHKMDSELLRMFIEHFLTLRVSLKRQGRKELLEIAKSGQAREEQRIGRLRQFFSGLTGR